MGRNKRRGGGKGRATILPTKEKAAIHALLQAGRITDAYARCIALCQVVANDGESWFILGHISSRLGRHDDAIASYRRSLAVNPNIANAHYNLGCALNQTERIVEAADAFRAAVKLNPAHAEACNSLGMVLVKLRNEKDGIKYLQKALSLRPDYQQARLNFSNAIDHAVPRWHFPMLNDETRNDTYDRAIRKSVNADSVVLDIGTGSGLLSMMAARAGAKHVYTFEGSVVIADKAREIIALNGFADKITVIASMSTTASVGNELPGRANVMVSEIVDVGLLGEGLVQSNWHARDHLLTADATIIPRGAKVYAALVESPALYADNHVHRAAGFDVEPFNEFSSVNYQQKRLQHFPHTYLTEPFEVFSFDFTGAPVTPDKATLEVNIIRDGLCHAVVMWFQLNLDDMDYIDSGPESRAHWMQGIQTFAQPLHVERGQCAELAIEHDCTVILFTGMMLK